MLVGRRVHLAENLHDVDTFRDQAPTIVGHTTQPYDKPTDHHRRRVRDKTSIQNTFRVGVECDPRPLHRLRCRLQQFVRLCWQRTHGVVGMHPSVGGPTPRPGATEAGATRNHPVTTMVPERGSVGRRVQIPRYLLRLTHMASYTGVTQLRRWTFRKVQERSMDSTRTRKPSRHAPPEPLRSLLHGWHPRLLPPPVNPAARLPPQRLIVHSPLKESRVQRLTVRTLGSQHPVTILGDDTRRVMSRHGFRAGHAASERRLRTKDAKQPFTSRCLIQLFPQLPQHNEPLQVLGIQRTDVVSGITQPHRPQFKTLQVGCPPRRRTNLSKRRQHHLLKVRPLQRLYRYVRQLPQHPSVLTGSETTLIGRGTPVPLPQRQS